ncbi:GIY-YIG nuclease family protein [Aurantiacibacter zhengii]|uniref:GIY-YIG nuclease family protein n=1 Tax=Aurantiacibacter zhengii TaxID=2307003 RepID=A0A418NSK6_9SPHN|nr:GIY-YIG nuclease family protein [Aurantiacibacter zhengii]RIV86497.1 GIY-YIG nuclease family protein [Aurantiacibacter zhengii]
MDREMHGGWLYIMADRYRGTMYVGMTTDLPIRITKHREGKGSEFCAKYGLRLLVWAEQVTPIDLCIAQEKRIKRWKREWKFALIEKANPDWEDLYERLA